MKSTIFVRPLQKSSCQDGRGFLAPLNAALESRKTCLWHGAAYPSLLFFRGFFVIIIIAFLAGCAKELKDMPVTQVAPEKVEKPPPMEELPVSQVVEEAKEKEKLYSLSVRDLDVRDVFFIFKKELPEYNIVMDPDVSGTVAVDFKDLPLDMALEYILEPLGLEYTMEENILRVSKPRIETRTFEFIYSTSTRTAKGALMAVTGGGGGPSGVVPPGGALAGGAASASYGSVDTTDTMNVWDELEAEIKNLLSDKGKLSINRRVGHITVTDYRSNLKRIEEFIDFFKVGIKRQILIRAKVLEVTLTEGSEFGIDWNIVLRRFSFLGARKGQIGGAIEERAMGPNLGGKKSRTQAPIAFKESFAPTLGRQVFPTAELFQFGITHENFDMVVRALETQGKVTVLSAPEVSTLNGQKAIIRSVREDAVFQTTVTTTSAGTTESTTVQPFTIGVYLDVIPHVDSEGMITMSIHPSVSSLVTTREFKGARKPIIDTRETDTIVTVKEGETVIIAGLMQDRIQVDISKVPLFGDIPFLGKAFRREIKSAQKSELVVLLSPTVVGPTAKDFGTARQKYWMLKKQFPK
ncbi:MAG TPA: secretin and TonB N-terminal domain-containing protein [Candidatus Hypogeohydataceae bacterium YC38]